MAAFAFMMPVVAGKEATDRETLARFATDGPERDAYVAHRRSQGITREAVWHQQTPMGMFAVVLLEAPDVAASFGRIATSDDPMAVRFREFVMDVHGIDLASAPPPAVQLLIDTTF